MKTLLAIAAVALGTFLFASDVQAQTSYTDGYQNGLGFGYGYRNVHPGCGVHAHFHQRVEQPPYFALYPPVYYNSTIVRRPMGVSPFAAPPGVTPVEMTGPLHQHVINPYYNPSPEDTPSETASETVNPET